MEFTMEREWNATRLYDYNPISRLFAIVRRNFWLFSTRRNSGLADATPFSASLENHKSEFISCYFFASLFSPFFLAFTFSTFNLSNLPTQYEDLSSLNATLAINAFDYFLFSRFSSFFFYLFFFIFRNENTWNERGLHCYWIDNMLLIKILFWLYWIRKYSGIEYHKMMRRNKASLTGSAYMNGG